ncbi:MAG: hypothetical protein LBU27_06915 [Candidatus Peribacteria bacterium]|jgi:hypothetical protein|nr:hypothetical protein [Candidatus Peribacteria bacterium]
MFLFNTYRVFSDDYRSIEIPAVDNTAYENGMPITQLNGLAVPITDSTQRIDFVSFSKKTTKENEVVLVKEPIADNTRKIKSVAPLTLAQIGTLFAVTFEDDETDPNYGYLATVAATDDYAQLKLISVFEGGKFGEFEIIKSQPIAPIE